MQEGKGVYNVLTLQSIVAGKGPTSPPLNAALHVHAHVCTLCECERMHVHVHMYTVSGVYVVVVFLCVCVCVFVDSVCIHVCLSVLITFYSHIHLCVGWLQFTPSQYYLLTIQYGCTALMLAAMGGHTLTVKALIGGGADPNIQDSVSCSVDELCSNMCYYNEI